jgi:LPS export ABC transporter protein LptC
VSKISKYYRVWTRLFVVLSIPFLLIACSKEKEYSPNKDFYKLPIQTMKDILLYKSDKGEVYAQLSSPIVQYYSTDSVNTPSDSSRTVFPKGIKVKFFNKDMTTKAFLTANYAINYTASSNLVYLKDSIKIINYNNQDTIFCKDLYWDQDRKIIYTNQSIRRYNAGGESFGDGMTANEQFDSVTVIRPHGRETIDDK